MVQFTSILGAALTPITLISGVGLILLSLVNRIGRTTDRTRLLIKEIEICADSHVRERKIHEVKIIHRRSYMIRNAMISIIISLTCSSLLVFLMIASNFLQLNFYALASSLLIVSVSGIIVSCIFFLIEVILALEAIEYEVQGIIH